jgi:hypothetical protein
MVEFFYNFTLGLWDELKGFFKLKKALKQGFPNWETREVTKGDAEV